MITICFTYFRSLALANLAAALYSVRCQSALDKVRELIIVDNDTEDHPEDIRTIVRSLEFPVPTRLLWFKHGDRSKTHSWSTNTAVREASSPWVFFSRADYLLDFGFLDKVCGVIEEKPVAWNGFVTSNGYHLNSDIGVCEETAWRTTGPSILREFAGAEIDYTCIDAGVWAARRRSFDAVAGLNEHLTAWGHAQTHFQWKLHEAGVEFVRIPETLFYHPQHSAQRDLDLAHQQLCDRGIDVRELWARHPGFQPYGRIS